MALLGNAQVAFASNELTPASLWLLTSVYENLLPVMPCHYRLAYIANRYFIRQVQNLECS